MIQNKRQAHLPATLSERNDVKNIKSLWNKDPKGRIFISYRRQDAQMAAGRLADSLSLYFGDNRVFRDIDSIEGGADFTDTIEDTLRSADAMIVLIGGDWLSASNESGQRRLDDPKDLVVAEIAAALNSQIPVYPVLLEDTQMPRTDDLPLPLQTLTRLNGSSISDKRWDVDVRRLAKIVSLDIPSATERTLTLANFLLSFFLVGSVVLTLTMAAWNSFDGEVFDGQWFGGGSYKCVDEHETFPKPELSTEFGTIGSRSESEPIQGWELHVWELLQRWQSGLIFVALLICIAGLFVVARLVDISKRRYIYASAWVGSVGTFLAFILMRPVCHEYEPLFLFFVGTVTATLMLGLMGLSGFKPK